MNLKALYKISYGLYVVSSAKDGKFNCQIANSICQVSSSPILVAACLNKQNLTNEFVKSSGLLSVSILAKDTPLDFIRKLGFKSGKDTEKFDELNYKIGKTGVPIVLDNAVAYIEAKVVSSFDVNTHTIFVGEVVDAEIVEDREVMTYEYYQSLKGKTPKTATTHLE
ncbi:flavin reductase [Archaeoglobales archaeon]|nr:MAG: flavin reductase [Archaeoglobales archaeon]